MLKNEITAKMETTIKQKNEEFAYLRALFIEKILKIVLNESNEVQQHISQSTIEHDRICTNEKCKEKYEGIKYKCDKCKAKVVKVNQEFHCFTKHSGADDRYINICVFYF